MSELERYGGRRPGRWSSGHRDQVTRDADRALARIESNTQIQDALIDSAADIATMKLNAISYIGRRAAQEVTVLTQFETQLALTTPNASARLASICDLTALALADTILDTTHRLRRIRS